MFKVGDWIRDGYGYPYKITSETEAECIDASVHKLWKPKEGEWCWQSFSDGEFNLHQYSSTSNEKLKYEPFIGELPSFIKEK